MGIDPPYTLPLEFVSGNEIKHFTMLCNWHCRKGSKHIEYFSSVLEVPAGQFPDYERMT